MMWSQLPGAPFCNRRSRRACLIDVIRSAIVSMLRTHSARSDGVVRTCAEKEEWNHRAREVTRVDEERAGLKPCAELFQQGKPAPRQESKEGTGKEARLYLGDNLGAVAGRV